MREKLMCFFVIVITFCLGSGLTYLYQEDKAIPEVVSSSKSDSVGVVKCDKDITIDETGISTSVGKIYDAVVTIQNYKRGVVSSMGSGFIYKNDDNYSYIMTNHHVIDGASKIEVTLSDDRVVEAKLLGSDQYLDLAIIRIDKVTDSVAIIGNSENSNVGDTVFTVGTPVSYEYRGTVTKGTLSGKNRMVSVSVTSSDDFIMKVLQVDAAINPGNSGGPLLNVNGEVIGINSMKLVEDEIEGMGFAIPIEYALKYVDELENGTKIERPLIGITMLNVTDSYALLKNGIVLDNSITSGVVVLSISSGTGAEKSDLKKGDVITKIGDVSVKNAAYLKYELYKYNPGDVIDVTYIRNKTELKTNVELIKSN